MITVTKNQGTIELLLDDTDIDIWMDAFITDRKAQHLSPGTITFYNRKFKLFNDYRKLLEIKSIKEISPQLIREYLIYLEEKGHNPGGVHAAFRALKAFINWWEDEFEPQEWKNPFRKLKSPKVPNKILEPATADSIQSLLDTCSSNDFYNTRDKAILYFLLDTGVRASELINIDVEDLNIITGEINIRKAKGGKTRSVFAGKRTMKSLRKYIRKRIKTAQPLFFSKSGDRLTYSGLRGIIRRRSERAGINEPTLHSFRRFFALEMLRNGVDIFSLQKLMGHTDLQILRRYLKQKTNDVRLAHKIGGPIDNLKI